jgi:hypothetical protein
MNNAKDILSRVYDIVMGKEESAVQVDLAQVKTADGAAIFDAEAFEKGNAVFIVTEEGNIPVPVGTYILEDGLTIMVDEQGVIIEVQTEGEEEIEEVEAKDMAEKEETGMMGDDMMGKDKMEAKMPKKIIKTKTEMEESYFNKFDARLSAIEKTNKDLEAVNVKLSAENEELKRQLNETPAEHTKFNPDAEVKRDFQFKIGARREESITDRVFNSLF